MNIDDFLQIVTVVSAVILVIAVLLQQRGATLGAGFGASGELTLHAVVLTKTYLTLPL